MKQEVRGKVFVKEATKSTETEISFTTLPPKSELGYFHIHNQVEETYIFLQGAEMIYICIQAKENSLEEHTTDDGERVVCKPKWRKERNE